MPDLANDVTSSARDIVRHVGEPNSERRRANIYKGIKMFPSKTSRDVGMVDGVSDTTGSCMENPTG